jgi:hypothetical protein
VKTSEERAWQEEREGGTCVACLRIIVVSASSTKKVLWPAKILSEAPILVKILRRQRDERDVKEGEKKREGLYRSTGVRVQESAGTRQPI